MLKYSFRRGVKNPYEVAYFEDEARCGLKDPRSKSFPNLASALDFVIQDSWERQDRAFTALFPEEDGEDALTQEERLFLTRAAKPYQILENLAQTIENSRTVKSVLKEN